MLDMSNIDYVKGLQSNMRATFETPHGQEVMNFLEEACGWYGSVINAQNPQLTQVNDGKRQVIATIKTLLRYEPEVIVALAKDKEGLK